jgi:hypothetical protein
MSSAGKSGDLLSALSEFLGVEIYPKDKVLQQVQRLHHMMRAIEEEVRLEDPMPLHGMVSRYEKP